MWHQKQTNYRSPRGEKWVKGVERYFEENNCWKHSYLGKRNKAARCWNCKKIPRKMTLKRHTPRHNIIKLSEVKDKELILKLAKDKKLVLHRGTPIRPFTDFSASAFQPRILSQ